MRSGNGPSGEMPFHPSGGLELAVAAQRDRRLRYTELQGGRRDGLEPHFGIGLAYHGLPFPLEYAAFPFFAVVLRAVTGSGHQLEVGYVVPARTVLVDMVHDVTLGHGSVVVRPYYVRQAYVAVRTVPAREVHLLVPGGVDRYLAAYGASGAVVVEVHDFVGVVHVE